jgi:hypothetical protein
MFHLQPKYYGATVWLTIESYKSGLGSVATISVFQQQNRTNRMVYLHAKYGFEAIVCPCRNTIGHWQPSYEPASTRDNMINVLYIQAKKTMPCSHVVLFHLYTYIMQQIL